MSEGEPPLAPMAADPVVLLSGVQGPSMQVDPVDPTAVF